MREKTCYIFGAMELDCPIIKPCKGDLIIAADKGYETLKRIGISPDLAVGDFDSLNMIPEDVKVLRHPIEKDDTDTALAVEAGIGRGYRRFMIYGCTGGRPDHTYANMQMLSSMAKRGLKAYLFGSGYTVFALKDGKVTFSERKCGTVSVFSITDRSVGVWEKGLKYTLDDDVLTNDTPLGVSNEFIGEKSEIGVKNGILLIMCEGVDTEDICF